MNGLLGTVGGAEVDPVVYTKFLYDVEMTGCMRELFTECVVVQRK
jgi:hypothetical protein